MELNEIINIGTAIIASLGGGALIVFGMSSWLGKVWANRLMQNDRAKHEKDLESLKNKLKKLEIEHNIVFSELHKKRAYVIETLYNHLVSSLLLVGGLLAIKEWDSEETKIEYAKKAWDEFKILLDYFSRHRIYLEKELSDFIQDFLKQLDDDRKRYTKHSHDMEISEESLEECRKSWESFIDKAPKAMEELQDEFRKILGVKKT